MTVLGLERSSTGSKRTSVFGGEERKDESKEGQHDNSPVRPAADLGSCAAGDRIHAKSVLTRVVGGERRETAGAAEREAESLDSCYEGKCDQGNRNTGANAHGGVIRQRRAAVITRIRSVVVADYNAKGGSEGSEGGGA